jgi:hypothetical protein
VEGAARSRPERNWPDLKGAHNKKAAMFTENLTWNEQPLATGL